MQISDNPTEWIEEVVSKKLLKYYEYEDFDNIEKIGSGSFGKVYRSKWKNSHKYFALKSLNLNIAAKEIAHEVFLI